MPRVYGYAPGHAERRASSASATSSAVYSGSTSFAEFVKRDLALRACLVRAAPLGDLGAQPLELGATLGRRRVSVEVSHRCHRRRSASKGRALRASSASAIVERRRRSPASSAGSRPRAMRFVAASLHSRRRALSLHHVDHALAQPRAPPRAQLPARFKITEVPVERRRRARRSPRPSRRPCGAPAASTRSARRDCGSRLAR